MAAPFIGQMWESRQALCNAGQTNNPRSGISFDARGAFAVVLAGGYEDNQMILGGDIVYYAGTGGRAPGAREQTFDQSFVHTHNAAMRRTYLNGDSIKLFRGFNLQSRSGERYYRYEGLYTIVEAQLVEGLHGFAICRFTLNRNPGQAPLPIYQNI